MESATFGEYYLLAAIAKSDSLPEFSEVYTYVSDAVLQLRGADPFSPDHIITFTREGCEEYGTDVYD
jgi:hypothetical protein